MPSRTQRRFRTSSIAVAMVALACAALGAIVAVKVQGGTDRRPLIGEVLASGSNFGLTGAVSNLTPGVSTTLTLTVTNPYTVPIDLTSVTVTVSPTPSVPSVPANCAGTLLSLNGSGFSGSPATTTYTWPSNSQPVIPTGSPTGVPVTLLLDRSAGNLCQSVTFPFNYAATATYGLTAPCVTTTVNTGFTVASGQAICIKARVNGGVIVQPGGALYMNGATIKGGVTSTGAVALEICGTSVSGTVAASGSTGFVMIGDGGEDPAEGAPCTTNTLSGGVTLSSNNAGFEVGGNVISGTSTFANNVGNGPTTEDTVPEIEGNTGTGSLACSSNAPAPINDGKHNTTTGPKTGQCAGL